MVDFAFRNEFELIDATNTITALHQSNVKGEFLWKYHNNQEHDWNAMFWAPKIRHFSTDDARYYSQATNKTKFLPTTDISKDFPINLQTQLNPIKSFHKQSSILKYVSPPRNKHITDISVGCKSLTHKNKDFSAEGHQSKSKFESTNSNPRVNTKQPNRPFYSMNILMIQREEIIYDFPDSFWMSEEFPSKLISQFEDDLDYS